MSPETDAAALGDTLDDALQGILETLAGTLSSNATAANQALNQVKQQLFSLLKSQASADDALLTQVVNTVLAELTGVAAVNQGLLDNIVAQLAYLTPGATVDYPNLCGQTYQVPGGVPGIDLTCNPPPPGPTAPTSGPTAPTVPTTAPTAPVLVSFNPPPPTGPTGPAVAPAPAPAPIQTPAPIPTGPSGGGGGGRGPCPPTTVNCPPPIVNIHVPACPTCPAIPQAATGPTAPPPSPTSPVPPVVVAPGAGGGGFNIPGSPPFAGGGAVGGAAVPTGPAQALGFVGDETWCANQPQVIAVFATFGNAVLGLLPALLPGGGFPSTSPPGWWQDALSTLPFGLGTLFNAVFSGGSLLADYAYSGLLFIGQAANTMLQATACGNPGALLGLFVARGVVRSLRHIRAGTDAGLWLTVDVEIQWDQLDAILEYLIKVVCQTGIPGPSQAMQLRQHNWIDDTTYRCWMMMGNENPDTWQRVYNGTQPRPGQSERQQFLWRYRAGDDPSGLQFGESEYQNSLENDGMLQTWQDLIFGMRYRLFSIREMRQLFDVGLMTEQQATSIFKREGFSDADAATLARMEVILYTRKHAAEIQGYTPSRIIQLVKDQQLDKTAATTAMKKLYYSDDDITTMLAAAGDEVAGAYAKRFYDMANSLTLSTLEGLYKLGMVTQANAVQNLLNLDAKQLSASAIPQLWDLQEANKTRTALVAAVKKGWGTGYLTNAGVIAALNSAGIPPESGQKYLSHWQAERLDDETVLAASNIVSAAGQGLIAPAQAAARLEGLGYTVADAQILLLEAENVLKASQASEQSKALASKTAAAKAAGASIKAAQAAEKAAIARLKQLTPPGTLKTWLKKGVISQQMFHDRMVQLGYPEDVIQAEITVVCNDPKAVCIPGDAQAPVSGPDIGGGTSGG